MQQTGVVYGQQDRRVVVTDVALYVAVELLEDAALGEHLQGGDDRSPLGDVVGRGHACFHRCRPGLGDEGAERDPAPHGLGDGDQ